MLLSVITFFNILDNGFVYDDNTVIGENTRVFNLWNIRYLFSEKYFRIVGKGKEYAFGEASYRPTVTATYFIDALIFKGTSWGSHLTNLLIHISNVLLVFLFLSIGLGLTKKTSLFGGLLFAVHPLVTEPVNAVGFREDLLVVFFCMAGMLIYSIYREKVLSPRKKIVIDSLHAFLYLLALFAKESAIVYPILLLMVLFYKKISIRREFVLLCLLIGISVFYLYIRFFVMVNPNVDHLVYPGGKISSNFYTMSTVFFGYIKLAFAPITLLADYNIGYKRNFLDVQVICSIALLVSLFFVSEYFFIKKKSLWAFGWCWFFICLAPVSNAIP
ncbi:hypothetical protein J7L67_09390, partial [bacterium]|nr:hypothetical protein [bacterium]